MLFSTCYEDGVHQVIEAETIEEVQNHPYVDKLACWISRPERVHSTGLWVCPTCGDTLEYAVERALGILDTPLAYLS